MLLITKEEDVKMVMFENTDMPESVAQKNPTTGKTEFVKTGNKVQMTTYTFRDGFGDKLVLLSKNNDFRSMEGKNVVIEIEAKRDEFNNKNKFSLVGCTLDKDQK